LAQKENGRLLDLLLPVDFTKQHPAYPNRPRNLFKFYYTGLIKSNLKDVKTDTANATPLTIKLHSIANVSTGKKAFAGELHMLDYMTRQPVTLNLKIHQKNNFIYFEASPLPYTHKIWAVMDSALKEIKL
jgi:hypothetical protein